MKSSKKKMFGQFEPQSRPIQKWGPLFKIEIQGKTPPPLP